MAARTIMIVDDTHDHRDILARLLRAIGYRVVEAEPGEQAIARAQAEAPDLVLTALSLPGQPLWETARALRALPALHTTPMLGTTVLTTLLPHSRIRRIMGLDYVDKPFDFDDLLERIRALLPDTSPAPALAA
ncbi:MAG TPA: response regulator [Roseiflexaceae bacterium]|nr:response regulator [Roseiflexaceae bacterium]